MFNPLFICDSDKNDVFGTLVPSNPKLTLCTLITISILIVSCHQYGIDSQYENKATYLPLYVIIVLTKCVYQ